MSSPDPLKALMHISQNFPKYATSIARRIIANSSLIEELQSNRNKAQEGVSMVWLNGMVLQNTDVNVFR
jgi:UDP-glucose:glycoprotein glucosyltransferase